jgi:paraquat-inducible protein B
MKRPNPKLIGAFVTLALVALAAMVITLGSFSILGKSLRFVLFFDQSVNGLQVGSAVKFRGVPVGTVQQIQIRHPDQKSDSTAIPVIISIDINRVQGNLGLDSGVFGEEAIEGSIRRGLYARLNLESFITGQMFVEFDFENDLLPVFHLKSSSEFVEIPTVPSSLDQITRDIADVIANVEAIDFARLNENFNRILEGAAEALEHLDFPELNKSWLAVMGSARDLFDSGEINELLASLTDAGREVEKVAARMDEFLDTETIDGQNMAESFASLLDGARKTLGQFDKLAATGDELIGPNSELRQEFEYSLRELSRTARSLRILADYLERNPRALLTGRADGEF